MNLSEVLSLSWIIYLIVFFAVWEGVLKVIALWKAAKNKELEWFICIGIFNTVGILPIIYILMQKKKEA